MVFSKSKFLQDPLDYAKKLSDSRELEELVDLLRHEYYNQEPLIPDGIYDKIEDLLKIQFPESQLFDAVGATTVGGVPLPYPMMSQNKSKSGEGTFEKWSKKYVGPYVLSDKLDGISLTFHKKASDVSSSKSNNLSDRVEINLYTRGNGKKGQDASQMLNLININHKYKTKISLGKALPDHEVTIRGEVIMRQDDWEKHYSQNHPNVRNYVSGAVARSFKDPQFEDLNRIYFVGYQLIYPILKPSEQFKFMSNLGFYVAPHQIYPLKFISEKKVTDVLTNAKPYSKQHPYQIDGLVVSQDIETTEISDKNPKTSIAFKDQNDDDMVSTKVIKVIWQASKRRLLKPVVIIEPINLSGATIKRATGHHARYIVDNGIGPGAVVSIVRSGEVIPYITEVLEPASPQLPDRPYEWMPDELNIILANDANDDQVDLSVLSHMAKTLEIDYLGPGTLKKLIEMDYRTPIEILNLNLNDLKKVPSLGKNAEKIWLSLEKLQTEGVKLSQLMDASNLFDQGVGSRIMQLVLDHHPMILEMIDDPDLENQLVQIKGIEKKTANKIIDGLPFFADFLDEVPHVRIIDWTTDPDEQTNKKSFGPKYPVLYGKRVIFTGIRDKELEQIITNNDGIVANSVIKTHPDQIVVAKDPDVLSSKIKSAKTLGIPVVSINQFKKKYLK